MRKTDSPVATRQGRPRIIRGWTISLAICACLAPLARGNEFDVLRTKWQHTLIAADGAPIGEGPRVSAAELAAKASQAWSTMKTGSSRTTLWSDLPFGPNTPSTNISRSFSELETMALAWATPGSALHGNAGLAEAIDGAMDWMVANVLTRTAQEYDNWWDWEIGGPQASNNTVALMYSTLTPEEIGAYCAAIDGHSPGGPANRYGWQWSTGTVDLGFVMIIRGILGKDSERMNTALNNIARVFPYVTTGNGFYADGSFVMHTNKAFTGAYGVILLNAVADLTDLLEGSTWQFTQANKARIFHWVTDSFEPVIYNGAMMDMVRGRTITRANETEVTSGIRAISTIRKIARFAPPSTAEALLRFAATPRLPRGQFQFAGMDRVVALRDGFGFGISMSSARIANFESINGENLHGWFTGDGMTYLYVGPVDTQFVGDYWPTVDPYHLPGTTVEIAPRADSEGAGKTTSQRWVGGAQVLGRYGAAGMSLADPLSPSLSAKKSWFMFDNEVVCLGTGISCAGAAEIDTTVEDRLLGTTPTCNFTVDGAVIAPVMGWSKALGTVSWCALDGVGGYYFPGGASNLDAAFVNRSGRRSDISGGSRVTASPLCTDDYLKLWFNHGARPAGSTYAYVILPNLSSDRVAAYASNPGVVVLANNPSVQAARNASLGVVAANFWTEGANSVDLITSNAPSSVVICMNPSCFVVGVSDPTQINTGSIRVALKLAAAALVSADPGVKVEQLSPTIILDVGVNGSLGRTFQASFSLNP